MRQFEPRFRWFTQNHPTFWTTSFKFQSPNLWSRIFYFWINTKLLLGCWMKFLKDRIVRKPTALDENQPPIWTGSVSENTIQIWCFIDFINKEFYEFIILIGWIVCLLDGGLLRHYFWLVWGHFGWIAEAFWPQISIDCGNVTLDFFLHGFCSSSQFVQTAEPSFANKTQSLHLPEERTLDQWQTVQFWFSPAQVGLCIVALDVQTSDHFLGNTTVFEWILLDNLFLQLFLLRSQLSLSNYSLLSTSFENAWSCSTVWTKGFFSNVF